MIAVFKMLPLDLHLEMLSGLDIVSSEIMTQLLSLVEGNQKLFYTY